jgi:hypothetical protein
MHAILQISIKLSKEIRIIRMYVCIRMYVYPYIHIHITIHIHIHIYIRIYTHIHMNIHIHIHIRIYTHTHIYTYTYTGCRTTSECRWIATRWARPASMRRSLRTRKRSSWHCSHLCTSTRYVCIVCIRAEQLGICMQCCDVDVNVFVMFMHHVVMLTHILYVE